MAGKSAKKHAANNTRILNQSIIISLSLLLLSSIRLFIISKNIISIKLFIKFILTHSPLLACLFILNKTGRPKWVQGNLINEGSMINLSTPQGVVEYILDIIYLSWVGQLSLIVFNSFKLFWFIWCILIPSYLIYILYGLKQKYWKSSSSSTSNHNKKSVTDTEQGTKSKRQLKREKNNNNTKIKYRNR